MQRFYTEPEKKIPVFGTYDVIVCGGGVAGFSAALASARNGAKTLIIEQYPFFGGTATASLMINLVGFRNQVPPDNKQVTRGIGEELMLRLIARGGARHSLNAYPSPFRSDTKGDLSYNYVVDSEMFKHEMLTMLKDAGVSILFHTYVADTIVEDGRVKGVLIENKSGRQAVFASVTVDATGDADVAYRAGAEFWQTCREENPRLTDCLMYRIGGFKEGTKAHGCLYGDTMVVWGPSPGAVNCADGKELSDSEVDVRSRIYEDLQEKIAENPDLEGARIVETPVQIGIRQTRFIVGEYQLTGEDVLEGRHFEDGIALAINPIIHYYGYRCFLKHDGYQIPYRCLIPKGVGGLIVAGRPISADQRAFESLRAMAHIFPIGEAAGTAAAQCAAAKVEPRDADVKKLREQLLLQGAELGI